MRREPSELKPPDKIERQHGDNDGDEEDHKQM
jgi:hypothetical protein